MGNSALWIIVVIPVGLAVAVGIVFSLFKRPAQVLNQRRRRMLDVAQHLGLRYYGEADGAVLPLLPSSSLFEKGTPGAVANLMAENRKPPRVLLLDYGAVTPPAEDAQSQYESLPLYLVAMARLRETARATTVRLYRKDWFGGPANVKGLYSLRFEGDPTFGKDFLVAGGPRGDVLRMLTGDVRKAIESWTLRGPQPVVEVLAGWAMVYVESEAGDRRLAQKATALVSYASRIARALSQEPPERPRGPQT